MANDFFTLFVVVLCWMQPPLVLSLFKKCEKVDQCKCMTDKGEMSLWKLAENVNHAPRFKDIMDRNPKFPVLRYYWNPCIAWTPKHVAGSCQNIAGYAKVDNRSTCVNLGKQDSAKFRLDSAGNCVLSYSATIFSSTTKSHLSVTLKCDDSTEGRVDPFTSDVVNRIFSTTLHSKYACIDSGLSLGSILVIIFVCVVVIYLVGGILINRFRKGATGKELLPNYSFWADFPSLVKDGIVYSCKSAKQSCCRTGKEYESI